MYPGMIRNQAVTLVSEPFTEAEASKSSTYREVRVFWHFFTKTNLLPFKNLSILQFTDNKSAEHILTFGSRNPEIQDMVHDIVIQCITFGIQLAARWMSCNTDEMRLADAGSRGP